MFLRFIGFFALIPIGQSFMFPVSQLERIVHLRVIGSELIQGISMELKGDRLIMNILNFHFEPRYYFFTTIILIFLYGEYKYNQGKENRIVALEKPEFNGQKRFFKEFLFVLAIIFAKDVESVF